LQNCSETEQFRRASRAFPNRGSKFGFFLDWIYDEQDSRQQQQHLNRLDHEEIAEPPFRRTCDAACQPARRKCVDEARTTRRPAGRAFVGRYLRQLDALHFARLDTLRPPSPEFVSPAVLRQEQRRCSLVRGLALAEMHTLHQQIAGSNFMIAFATAEGLLLDIISDSSFDDASNAACICAGAVWTEKTCGTNGLGTAAYLKRPIVVHGREHFFARYNNLTCVAAPIFAPDGELAGILDASSDCMSRQAHTQALVAMAATRSRTACSANNIAATSWSPSTIAANICTRSARACWQSTMAARSRRKPRRARLVGMGCRPRRAACSAMSSARRSVHYR